MPENVTGSIFLYPAYVQSVIAGGTHFPVTDSILIGLLTADYVPNEDHDQLPDVTPFEVQGAGYSRQPALAAELVNELQGNRRFIRFSFDPVTFTASGGTLLPKYWFAFNNTDPGNPLIAWGQIDVSQDDPLAVLDGKLIKVVPNDLGFYRSEVPRFA